MTDHQQRRLQNWRLELLDEAASRGSVAKTCCHGRPQGRCIGREIAYWRLQLCEAEGLGGLRDRSHRSHY